ncbi:MAG: carboxymuconolactone decarboxylase family protein [Phycisphaerales bacterium]|nr:carboxymuconolactone decarboxylase family protein [Phycisphaerales bacterium]
MKPATSPEQAADLARRRRELAPETIRAFRAFSDQVFKDGALPRSVKELIAVAVAHVTQCTYCIEAHARRAHQHGVSDAELMEAIWVAAEMRAGGAYAHSLVALQATAQSQDAGSASPP